ncbi:MAG: hypothetical protein ACRD1Z_04065, partial [Vicinamibacteria bacterium]
AQACARIESGGMMIEEARALLDDLVSRSDEYEISFNEAVRSESAFIRSRYPDEWRGGAPVAAEPSAEEKKRGTSTSAKLIEIGLRTELFHDERHDAYAVVEDNGVRRILRVRSSSFRNWLAHSYYREISAARSD